MAIINGQDLFFFPTGTPSGGSQEGSLYRHLVEIRFTGYLNTNDQSIGRMSSGYASVAILDNNSTAYTQQTISSIRNNCLAIGHICSDEGGPPLYSISSIDFSENGIAVHCAHLYSTPIEYPEIYISGASASLFDIYSVTDIVTTIPVPVLETEGGGGTITVDPNYSPESDNAQSGKAVAEAIESISGTKLITENLEFTHTTSYPEVTKYSFTTSSTPTGYWVYKAGNIKGGILSVNWDTSQLSSFNILLYLFDELGNPHMNSQGGQKIWAGELCDPGAWYEPANGSGFNKATAPFTFKVPDGCTVQLCMRSTSNTVFPSGSSLTSGADLLAVAETFFEVKVSKEIPYGKIDVAQGKENASRILMTDRDGNIFCGATLPVSTAFTPTWDTVIHRGWISGATENTLPAFFLAKENGYDWVECDVTASKEGIPVLAHDTTITGTNASGATETLTVLQSTLEQLKSLTLSTSERFGEIKIATLAELLEMARLLDIKILLDMKVSAKNILETIAKTVVRYGMSKNVVYMPELSGAPHIAAIDKNANFDFVQFGANPTIDTDFSAYTALLTGGNRVNIDVNAASWGFDESVIKAINAAGLGLSAWNVQHGRIAKCLNAGAVRITKANSCDAADLNAIYFATKSYW